VAGFDLRDQAAQFAAELSDLLNKTICNGIRVTPIVAQSGRAVLGYKITKQAQDTAQGVPVTLSGKKPRCFLGISFRLEPDAEREYLAVTSSFVGVFSDASLEHTLMHYDYERGKVDGYPEAHLQVCAQSDGWSSLCERANLGTRPLEKLHFPVGGRRYRPTLEDVIDFLVCEKLVDARDGWDERVEEGREGFRQRQLRAAVRRDPDTAIDALKKAGRWHPDS
jgi:hypothetical protein